MKLVASDSVFAQYCESAAAYWANNISHSGDQYILVEILHEEIRVALRNLTIANAIRRVQPAALVVVTGTDYYWFDALFSEFDVAAVRQLAAAFGASEVIDIHDAVDRHLTAEAEPGRLFAHLGRQGANSTPQPIDPKDLKSTTDSTICRLLKVPRPANLSGADEITQRTNGLATAYEELFDRLRPVAFVTSHLDYNQWGLGVDAAQRYRVPVIHTQPTGGLKAYGWFPQHSVGKEPPRAQVTRRVGEWFADYIWPRRDVLWRSAELIAWRSKGNMGRPSWWRGGAAASVDLRTVRERNQIREVAARRLGLDPTRPVIGVFNHALSDAQGANKEIFPDLAAWFEETAQYAGRTTRASWLFLDHPAQARYDSTDFFGSVAKRHLNHTHIAFQPSLNLSKNLLWSLVDVGVTIRGSVSNELPAYGIPVIQAGWSEWSACGLSDVAEDQAEYWKLLESHIDALTRNESAISASQVERARLWHWLYRSGTDVATPVMPHWEELSGDGMLQTLSIHMRHVEADGDPAFLAVRRMWERREPFLTRFDLSSDDELAAAVLSRDDR